MTRTYCDRCGVEGLVQKATFSTPSKTEAMQELCRACVEAITAAFHPQATGTAGPGIPPHP